MMTLIEKPANWGDGRLAYLRTISSQSRFRVLLYRIESGEGHSLALISGRAGLSRLLVDHCPLCGEEGPARVPDQWLSRTVTAGVWIHAACMPEPETERPFMPWVPSGTTTTISAPIRNRQTCNQQLSYKVFIDFIEDAWRAVDILVTKPLIQPFRGWYIEEHTRPSRWALKESECNKGPLSTALSSTVHPYKTPAPSMLSY